ncbi:hypothetical protein E6H16_06965 [Candidatus Bathyarchaeota archaeon]|nr:MAG: hypothetical protein E6H16_06965 [Candidatus Bathyarchaeota archaeon]
MLHALARGLEDPSLRIRNKSRAASIIIHESSAVPFSGYNRLIADMERKKSQAYMIQNRTSLR